MAKKNKSMQFKRGYTFRAIIFIALSFVLYSCSESVSESESRSKDTENSKNKNNEFSNENADWSNPVLIMGTSFGKIINSYYRLGDFDKLYQLSDQKSKSKYGKSDLIQRWKQLPLGMELRLLNKTVEEDVQWLHYETTIDATRRMLRIPVSIEDDTCRVLFDKFEKELILISKTQ